MLFLFIFFVLDFSQFIFIFIFMTQISYGGSKNALICSNFYVAFATRSRRAFFFYFFLLMVFEERANPDKWSFNVYSSWECIFMLLLKVFTNLSGLLWIFENKSTTENYYYFLYEKSTLSLFFLKKKQINLMFIYPFTRK